MELMHGREREMAEKRGREREREWRSREGGEGGRQKCTQGGTGQMSNYNPNRTQKTPCCYCVAVKLHHRHHGHRWGDLNKYVWTVGPDSDLQVG